MRQQQSGLFRFVQFMLSEKLGVARRTAAIPQEPYDVRDIGRTRTKARDGKRRWRLYLDEIDDGSPSRLSTFHSVGEGLNRADRPRTSFPALAPLTLKPSVDSSERCQRKKGNLYRDKADSGPRRMS